MPRIPTYQRQVNAIGSPVPVYTVKAPDMNDGWRAVDSAMNSAIQLAGTIKRNRDEKAERARIENEKIEAAEVLAAKVELSRSLDEQSKGTIDPVTGIKKPGLMDREGKDAIGIQRDFQDHYNKELARISAGLTSPQARISLQQFALPDKEARRQDYAAREFNQMKIFQDNQQKAMDFRSGNLAADGSVSDALALAALDEAKKGFLAMNQGQSKQVLDAGIASRDSNFAAARLSAAPDYASKQAAFAKYGNLLQGEQAVQAREMMKVFGVKDKAQGVVDQLASAHDLTKGTAQVKAQAEINNIKDLEVRDEAQRRFDYRVGQSTRLRNAQDSQVFTESMKQIQGGAMPEDIPGYAYMRAEVRDKVEQYSREYRKGQLVDQGLDRVAFSDPKKWDEMQKMPREQLKKFDDWMALRGALTEEDVRGLQNKQAHMIAQDAENVKKLGEAGAEAWNKRQEAFEKSTLDDLLKTYENTELDNLPAGEGVKDKDSRKAERRANIEREWMRQLDDHWKLKGKAPTHLEVSIIRNRMTDKISTLDAEGDKIQKFRWEMTNFDREVGIQYDSIKEYQTVNGLSDANLEKQLRDSGMPEDAFLQKLNDQAMGDFETNSSQATVIPFKKSSGFRDQSRERQASIMSQSQIAAIDNKAKELSEDYGGGAKGSEAVDDFTSALPELLRREGRDKETGFWANLTGPNMAAAKDLYRQADAIEAIKDPAERRRAAMAYLEDYRTAWGTYKRQNNVDDNRLAAPVSRGR